MGTNLSGMEWANPGLRHGLSSEPNIHFSVPRAAEVAYLALRTFSDPAEVDRWLVSAGLHIDTRDFIHR